MGAVKENKEEDGAWPRRDGRDAGGEGAKRGSAVKRRAARQEGARRRRVAGQGQDHQEVPRHRLHREGVGGPRDGSAEVEDGRRHRARLHSPSTWSSAARARSSPRSRSRRRPSTSSTSRPTPIARARRSRGTWRRRSRAPTATSSASSSTRSPSAASPRRSQHRASSTCTSSSRSRRGAFSIAWWATRSRRSCGRR